MDDLVKYRLESSQEKLESAKILLDAGQFKETSKAHMYGGPACSITRPES